MGILRPAGGTVGVCWRCGTAGEFDATVTDPPRDSRRIPYHQRVVRNISRYDGASADKRVTADVVAADNSRIRAETRTSPNHSLLVSCFREI